MTEPGRPSSTDELKETTKTVLAKLERLALQDSSKPEKTKPTRTRTRARKGNRKDSENMTAPDMVDSDPIDHSMQFLLELLRLPQDHWMGHLRGLAIRKGVVSRRRQSSGQVFSWNPSLEGNEHTEVFVSLLNSQQAGGGRTQKKKRFFNLDETINELISDQNLHVTLSPNKIRSEAELDKAMKRLARALEAAGLGYEDEGELFVTKQGRTAFVRTDPEVVIRKRKLLRCALNGDIVRVFIFKDASTANVATSLIKDIIADGQKEDDEDDEEEDGETDDEEVAEELAKCSATGFIVRIVKEVHERSCVGQFKSAPATAKTANLLFFPHEMGIPPVNVSARSLSAFIPQDVDLADFYKTLSQRLFEVELTSSNSFYNTFNGRVVGALGLKGNIMDENACIMLRHGFKVRSIDRLERLGEAYVAKAAGGEEAEVQSGERSDLCDMCIFTIDPATAKDLDDAVSCRQLENGNVEVGIHISDVTHYVVEDSDLDLLVQQAKTTSVYMVDKVYHMLPSLLCTMCSLLPGERKRAVSVFVEMTQEARVVSTRFTRSLINSCCQMSYEQAQQVIDDGDPLSVAPLTIYNGFSLVDLRRTIKTLHRLASMMRNRRMRNGALKFDKPKYYFRLDANNEPTHIFSELSKPANHLIEEFMILANEVAARFIYEQFPEWAVLRQHSPPKLDQMAKVQRFFRDLDFPELNYRTAQDINASMEQILEESRRRGLDQEGFQLVLNCMLAKPMNRAQYFCTGDQRYVDKFDHFALSIPFYTHFTSPIRRYPDMLVHRLLLRALKKQPPPKTWHLPDLVHLLADCNRHKMNSRYASEDSARLFFLHFLRKHFPGGREMKATVCSVLLRSLEVKLWETGDELNIQLADLEAAGLAVERKDDGVVTIEKKGSDGGTVELKVFSTCRVLVSVPADREYLRAVLVV